jgi:hypothetical protein
MQSSNTTTAAADSRSDRPMQRRATHTATQQHSNTATQQRTLTTSTLPLINQRASHTDIQSHNAADTHTPLHCTLNMLVDTVVTHNGGASSAATPHRRHLQHLVAVAVGSYTTAVEHCDCDMHDQRACIALVRNMAARPPPPSTTSAQRLSPTTKRCNACVRATERTDTHDQT